MQIPGVEANMPEEFKKEFAEALETVLKKQIDRWTNQHDTSQMKEFWALEIEWVKSEDFQENLKRAASVWNLE